MTTQDTTSTGHSAVAARAVIDQMTEALGGRLALDGISGRRSDHGDRLAEASRVGHRALKTRGRRALYLHAEVVVRVRKAG
jgi:hypothetical protein